MIRVLGMLACATCLGAAAPPGLGRSESPTTSSRSPGELLRACTSVDRTPQAESLLGAARRAARAFARHEFDELVAQSNGILLSLPGSDPSAPLQPAQAALLLHAFADGADQESVEVVVARHVDRERAYVEARRVFTLRGTTTRRTQTIYLGLRLERVSYRLVELRVVP